jgi:hypothetical protein
MDRVEVYVTQEVLTANYGPAEEWGEVKFITVSELSNVPNSLHNAKVVAGIRSKLAEFRPDVDYIAPSGSPIITGLVFAVLRERTSKFNILKWNSRDKAYSAIKINVAGEQRVY